MPAIRYLNCVATPYVDVLYTIPCAWGGGGGGGGGEEGGKKIILHHVTL